jgi:hypothetical protein
MTTLLKISSDLRNVPTKVKSNVNRALFSESSALKKDFQQRAPVDSGRYQRAWRISRDRLGSSGMFASVSIFNPTNSYGVFMEYGADINKAPWYYPGVTKKKTGKLTKANNSEQNGRIWAGGLNPGHSKTIGGAIDPVLFQNTRRLLKLTKVIANAAIQGFK